MGNGLAAVSASSSARLFDRFYDHSSINGVFPQEDGFPALAQAVAALDVAPSAAAAWRAFAQAVAFVARGAVPSAVFGRR